MFITLEGIDGCGKTTQAARLYRWFLKQGKRVEDLLWTREPGDWVMGRKVRSLLLDGALRHPLSELLFFLGDRCEHVAQRIKPALDAGKIVICERYSDSTLAYQCWGRGIGQDLVKTFMKQCAFPVPDLTLWLQVPPQVAMERLGKRGGSDSIEREGLEFYERVASGFSELAALDHERICPINGDQPSGVVAEEIQRIFEAMERVGQ